VTDTLANLSWVNASKQRLQLENQRLQQKLRASRDSEHVAWDSYKELRNLFSPKSKEGAPDLDEDDAASLKLCIVNLVVKDQHRELQVQILLGQLNVHRAEIQRLRGTTMVETRPITPNHASHKAGTVVTDTWTSDDDQRP
jgi:hypothetical protein